MSQPILSDAEVLKGVRDEVSKGKVRWTKHVEERMTQRGFDREQIKECLLTGSFVERPTIPNRPGDIEYCFRMEASVDGEAISVAASLIPDSRVVVITVFEPK